MIQDRALQMRFEILCEVVMKKNTSKQESARYCVAFTARSTTTLR
jgi:hypothetical protein